MMESENRTRGSATAGDAGGASSTSLCLVAADEAQGVYVRKHLKAFNGTYDALRDYLMINGGMVKQITEIIVDAFKGLHLKISILPNDDRSSAGIDDSVSGAINEIAGTKLNDSSGMDTNKFLVKLSKQRKEHPTS